MLKYEVVMIVPAPVFMVIHKLLGNIRLGDNNLFEEAITDFMCESEETDQEIYNEMIDKYGEPTIGFEYNDEEGAVINIRGIA